LRSFNRRYLFYNSKNFNRLETIQTSFALTLSNALPENKKNHKHNTADYKPSSHNSSPFHFSLLLTIYQNKLQNSRTLYFLSSTAPVVKHFAAAYFAPADKLHIPFAVKIFCFPVLFPRLTICRNFCNI